MYSFMPRGIQDRTSYFNPLNLLFNFESCYIEENFLLREKILAHRNTANFPPDLLQSDSSWFSDNLEVAFEDLNENSYVLAPQKRPRHHLSMNDFRVTQPDYGKYEWGSLGQLEVDIGDFLLNRNRLISESRPEHLNDPMNYFFFDLKRIARLLAKEKSTDMLSDSLGALLHYINFVETELAFDSQDRMFIGQVREMINKRVLPQIKEKMGSDSLKLKLTTLVDEIERVADTCHRELHYDFQDQDVNPHIASIWGEIDENEKRKHPLQALLGCVQESEASNQVSLNRRASQALFFDNKPDKASPFTVKLLEDCEPLQLMQDLSEQDKSIYANLASNINKLLQYKSLLKSLVGFVDEVGQYQVIKGYQTELLQFLDTIKTDISKAQESHAALSAANLDIKNKLLRDNHQKTELNKWSSYLSATFGLSTQTINVKGFMQNQDIKHLTSIKDPDKIFTSATSLVEDIQNAMKSWQAAYDDEVAIGELTNTYQQLLSDIQLASGLPPLEIAPPPKPQVEFEEPVFSFNCNYQYDDDEEQRIECVSGSGFAYVLPNQYEFNLPYHGDNFLLPDCQQVLWHGRSAIQCIGYDSTVVYQSDSLNNVDTFTQQINGQIALGRVIFYLANQLYYWTFSTDGSLASVGYQPPEVLIDKSDLNMASPYAQKGQTSIVDTHLRFFSPEQTELTDNVGISKGYESARL